MSTDPNAVVTQGPPSTGGNPFPAGDGTALANVAVVPPGAFTLGDGSKRPMGMVPYLWNNATYDALQGCLQFQADAKVNLAANGNSADLTNISSRGLSFFVNISAISGASTTLTVKIQAKDPASGNYVDIPGAATVALSAVGIVMVQVGMGLAPVANQAVAAFVPRTYRFVYTVGGGAPLVSFTVGVSLQP